MRTLNADQLKQRGTCRSIMKCASVLSLKLLIRNGSAGITSLRWKNMEV